MAINFISLEKSEIELNKNFLSLVKLCRKMYSKLGDMFDSKTITENNIEKMELLKNQINESRRDIRDDCVWIISKDQPRAGHLRFIIAVLYSIKDIQRMSEYALTIAKILFNEKLTSRMIKHCNQLFKSSILFFDKVIKLLSTAEVEKYEEQVSNLFNDFRKIYKLFLTESIDTFSVNNSNKKIDIENYFNFSIVIKYIDRIVDHAQSIYNNFMLIHGSK